MLEEEFYKHHKVKEARRLLIEAEGELIAERKEGIGNDLCECGHLRKEHGPSYSINYTGGVCHKCKCLNFLYRK